MTSTSIIAFHTTNSFQLTFTPKHTSAIATAASAMHTYCTVLPKKNETILLFTDCSYFFVLLLRLPWQQKLHDRLLNYILLPLLLIQLLRSPIIRLLLISLMRVSISTATPLRQRSLLPLQSAPLLQPLILIKITTA